MSEVCIQEMSNLHFQGANFQVMQVRTQPRAYLSFASMVLFAVTSTFVAAFSAFVQIGQSFQRMKPHVAMHPYRWQLWPTQASFSGAVAYLQASQQASLHDWPQIRSK